MYDVLILGAGAGGLMCASGLAEHKTLKIGVIDANQSIGAKIKISGGGKCNITNTKVSEENYLGEAAFVSWILSKYTKEDLLEFLEANGLSPVIRKGRYYFCPKSSDEIISIFKRLTKSVDYRLGENILYAEKKEDMFFVKTSKSTYRAKSLVVATGGESYKSLNASDIGLKIASGFGVQSIEFSPALVGMTLQKEQFWMKELSGVSAEVEITVEGKTLREDMLFAHRGISGPVVLSASLYWKKGSMSINFLPQKDINKLINGSKKNISSVLNLPKRLSKGLLEVLNIEDKPCSKLTKEDMQNLQNIHKYAFAPAGNFGFTKAEASRGGVKTEELDKNSMMSKKVDGLYFIGEVVDVTGELGGYNFQWAFSSAVVCSKYIKGRYNM
ncbi:aminoacetone oxidase family FAD-binding enzyme [Sulfurimonas sp. HSL-1716]|uniref:NAD(P)/FAD-dependent oxidoreductase n=1 Tax=Hydrocurvibacter sulfurireducens TaxID=3131937 RepID=UPI0031FA04F9